MKQLISKIQHKIPVHNWRWITKFRIFLWRRKLDKYKKCATVSEGKNYNHKVDIVGEVVETTKKGWVKYGCVSAGIWCVMNGISQFDVVGYCISTVDYKVHYIFGFKHAEDALALRLGYVK